MTDGDIRRYAQRLRLGVIGVFALVLLLVLCGRFGVRVAGAPVLLQSRFPSASLFTVADGVLLLLALALYWLTEALRAVAAGGLFSRLVVRRFRLFALWMLIMALFSTLAPMVLAAGTPGRHRLMLVVDVRDLLLIGLTLLLLLIARMLERARSIEDEMSEIV